MRPTRRSGRANAALRPDAGEERGEGAGGFGFGGGDPGRERQLVDVGAGDQAGEFGEQRGVREDRRRPRGRPGRGSARGARSGRGREGVDVGLDVPARPPGEFVAYGFVPIAG
ncbi:hypothetical protein [Streptomyces sp. NPDC056165]|uniref:hypothetical protein n=1 Tax=Streptomyces sp. NPDC056165 TaxID=3345733 RepID=UPI0035D8047F